MKDLPRPQSPHREIAVLGGGHEDDLALAGGYLDAATITACHWSEHGPNDGLPLPILFLYRHSIELSLKWLIRMAARCAVRDGYGGKEDLSPTKVEERLHTHNIKKLVDCLNRYLGYSQINPPDNRIDPQSLQLLGWLDTEDTTGETYRYAMIGRGSSKTPARPTQKNLNFYEQINELHKLANLLYGGYSGWLDQYEQTQLEMKRLHGA